MKPGFYWAHWLVSGPYSVIPKDEMWTVVKVADEIVQGDMEAYVPGRRGWFGISEFDKFIGPLEPPNEPVAKITVKYWILNTWAYSIDDKPAPSAKLNMIEIDQDETYTKNNKRYYRLHSGHGIYTDLLIE